MRNSSIGNAGSDSHVEEGQEKTRALGGFSRREGTARGAEESGFVVCLGGTGPSGLAVWRRGGGDKNLWPSFTLQGLGEPRRESPCSTR